MVILEKLDIANNQEEIKKLTSKKDELQDCQSLSCFVCSHSDENKL